MKAPPRLAVSAIFYINLTYEDHDHEISVQINIQFLTLDSLHTYQDGKMMSSLIYVIFVERSQGYSFPPQPTVRASSSLRRNRVLTIIRKMLEKWYASTLSLIGSQDIAT